MLKKTFVSSNLKATMTCPKCNKIEQKDLSRFIGHESQVKLKHTCCCDHRFSVFLERRRSIRKDVQFRGNLIKNTKKYPIVIENMSKYGVRVRLLEIILLEDGQEIMIEFTLDDPNKSKVQRAALVQKKFLSSADIGCEFITSDHYGNLGKYFLFYF